MPDYIFSGDTPIAQPAFRILAYWPAGLGDAAVSAGLAPILDAFLAQYREDVAFMVVADESRPMKGNVVDDALLADARDWLATAPKAHPATARIFGPVSERNQQITVPSFRVEQHMDYGLMDISVPADPETAAALANQVTVHLRAMPTLYAVMGMGFFLPLALEGSERAFPKGFARYKTAIEFMAEGPEWCIQKGVGFTDWDELEDETDGFVDIGWRTILGSPYLPRLGDVAIDADGVTVERDETMLIVTAGDVPIWGDVNIDEDISAYRAISEALAPARASVRPMLNGLFGAQVDDPEGTDRVEAWYDRYKD